ncbi:MAG: hypothetical protein VX589_16870 [Myxococcota bacterium]|nr:hypothetical protein [Myxococcota bacterium]
MSLPWNDEPIFCMTADVDWASEEAIARCHALFSERDITTTYFNTHPSPFLNGLRADGRIHMGIHPNFLAGSSQGEGFDTVLDYLAEAVPDVECFRSHRYFDVTDINVKLADRGCRYDSNLFTFLHKLPPHTHFTGMTRFPCCWEDGTWLRNVGSVDLADVTSFLFSPGLTILSVHPMHMALNSPTLGYAREVKDRVSREAWNAMDVHTLDTLAHGGRGIRDLTADMLDAILARGHTFYTLDELNSIYASQT